MTWNQTLNGKRWDFLNPDPGAIDWPTIALVLSRIPRFNGHTTSGPYSVAQHLVEGARAILRETGRRDWAAAYLLHDVHESVIGDDVRPKVEALAQLAGNIARSQAYEEHNSGMAFQWLDNQPELQRKIDGTIYESNAKHWLKAAFQELKARADAVIYPAAGLPWPLSLECKVVVREFDNRMLRTEADARTGPRVAPWADVVEKAEPIEGADMSVWPTELAKSLWLGIARELLPALAAAAPVEQEGCECCEPSPKLVPFPVWEVEPGTNPWGVDPREDLRGWPDSPPPAQTDTGAYGAIASDTLREQAIKELGHGTAAAPAAVKDWCDWADGGRPGTCTACGGVFGMFSRPSVCKRAAVAQTEA